jgi:hypothetical protein
VVYLWAKPSQFAGRETNAPNKKLAELYEVETKSFNHSVTRNLEGFPDDL